MPTERQSGTTAAHARTSTEWHARRGATVDFQQRHVPESGQLSTYRLTVPTDYVKTRSWPLVVGFHGWAFAHDSNPGLHAHGLSNGYIVATPTGYKDDKWPSWNGGGSTRSPGPAGPTCTMPRSGGVCYKSCGRCADACWWTTCEDSVAQILALLDEISTLLSVDSKMVYAVGHSNGATFLYELAADARSAPKFAAFVAIAGLPHVGFNRPPLRPTSFLGLFGAADPFMPPTANLSLSGGDRSVSVDPTFGSRYAVARDVSTTWASAAGCDVAAAVPYALLAAPASAANRCTRWARGCHGGAEVVECVHAGGHEPPSWSVATAWSFFRRHKAHTDCHDTPGWTNGPRPGGALGCAEYAEKFCTGFGLAVGAAWAGGAAFNHPERHCVACGKKCWHPSAKQRERRQEGGQRVSATKAIKIQLK